MSEEICGNCRYYQKLVLYNKPNDSGVPCLPNYDEISGCCQVFASEGFIYQVLDTFDTCECFVADTRRKAEEKLIREMEEA